MQLIRIEEPNIGALSLRLGAANDGCPEVENEASGIGGEIGSEAIPKDAESEAQAWSERTEVLLAVEEGGKGLKIDTAVPPFPVEDQTILLGMYRVRLIAIDS